VKYQRHLNPEFLLKLANSDQKFRARLQILVVIFLLDKVIRNDELRVLLPDFKSLPQIGHLLLHPPHLKALDYY
jgi:hypothetical protein